MFFNQYDTVRRQWFERCKLIFILGVLLVISISLSACSQLDLTEISDAEVQKQETVEESEKEFRQESYDKVEISMEEAILLGMEEASNYYDNLQLTEVHSYDNDQNIDELAGSDGRRQWWYVNFANEEQNYVSILIRDGEIDVVEHFDSNGNNGLLNLKEIQLTAETAVNKAREMGLRGGNPKNQKDWASGFHFKMSYASLLNSPDDIRVFFEVIGISPNGNFARVYFDAVTEEVLLAEEKIEYDNGDVEWKEIEW